MKPRFKFTAIGAAIGLVGSLGLAIPAHAATFISDNLKICVTRALPAGLTAETATPAQLQAVEGLACSFPDGEFGDKKIDLTGIERLPNIKNLYFKNMEITNIGPIASLKNLEQLEFESSVFNDFAPIGQLTKLEKLIVSQSAVTFRGVDPKNNYETLSGLTNLKHLEFYSTGFVTDLKPFSNMLSLEKLVLKEIQRDRCQPDCRSA